MHITHRPSDWIFQIRIPHDVEAVFSPSPIRLNLGPAHKRGAARAARLLAGHAESTFLACRKGRNGLANVQSRSTGFYESGGDILLAPSQR